MAPDFRGLRALLINCSLEPTPSTSHTHRLCERVAGVMRANAVEVEILHARAHAIAFGMVKDARASGAPADDWPRIHARVMAADILVLGTPIWLGVKSSVATLVVERLYAYSGERDDRGQIIYYGKAGGALVTGNEDGVKACARDLLYALQHIGFLVPPQADCGWIGEIGPGPSYGDVVEGRAAPVGYDKDFTNRNATIMAYNLMHAAALLRAAGGFPAYGNQAASWREVPNAADVSPEPVRGSRR